jgi:hypothetical protein
MATISIDLNGEVTTFTLSDVDANRMLAHYTIVHPGTQSEVIHYMADICVEMLAASTVQAEKQAAAQAAADAIPPIDVNIVP